MSTERIADRSTRRIGRSRCFLPRVPICSGPHVVLSFPLSSRIFSSFLHHSSAAHFPTWGLFFVPSLPPPASVWLVCFPSIPRRSSRVRPAPSTRDLPSTSPPLPAGPSPSTVEDERVHVAPGTVPPAPRRVRSFDRHPAGGGGGWQPRGDERGGRGHETRGRSGGWVAMAGGRGVVDNQANRTTHPTAPHTRAHANRPTNVARKARGEGVRRMAEHAAGKDEMESSRSGGTGDTTQRIIAKLMREASYSGATGEALMDLHQQQRWKEKELDASPRSTTSSDEAKNWCVRRHRAPPRPRGAKTRGNDAHETKGTIALSTEHVSRTIPRAGRLRFGRCSSDRSDPSDPIDWNRRFGERTIEPKPTANPKDPAGTKPRTTRATG